MQILSEGENKQNLNINKLRKALEKVLIPLSPQELSERNFRKLFLLIYKAKYIFASVH